MIVVFKKLVLVSGAEIHVLALAEVRIKLCKKKENPNLL